MRFVALPPADGSDGPPHLVRDDRHRLPGRGAWLHDDPACLEAARKRGAFRRPCGLPGSGNLRHGNDLG
ncbi:YlxR family protein [Tsukamurella sp. PLM1]|uniref:YlxR family protein n=1 Tax=Tsukamurella sp. PLM1 TaxID=2929795 RepID=UPI0020C0F80C|nr:YlxR family protein [Tsukamurella sp. PLM1]